MSLKIKKFLVEPQWPICAHFADHRTLQLFFSIKKRPAPPSAPMLPVRGPLCVCRAAPAPTGEAQPPPSAPSLVSDRRQYAGLPDDGPYPRHSPGDVPPQEDPLPIRYGHALERALGGSGWVAVTAGRAPVGRMPRARDSCTRWDGMRLCPPPVLADPEAPPPEVIWQTCQVVSGSLQLDSGLQSHCRPSARRNETRRMPMPMHTCMHNRVRSWSSPVALRPDAKGQWSTCPHPHAMAGTMENVFVGGRGGAFFGKGGGCRKGLLRLGLCKSPLFACIACSFTQELEMLGV